MGAAGRRLREVSSGSGAVWPLRRFDGDPGLLCFFTAARAPRLIPRQIIDTLPRKMLADHRKTAVCRSRVKMVSGPGLRVADGRTDGGRGGAGGAKGAQRGMAQAL